MFKQNSCFFYAYQLIIHAFLAFWTAYAPHLMFFNLAHLLSEVVFVLGRSSVNFVFYFCSISLVPLLHILLMPLSALCPCQTFIGIFLHACYIFLGIYALLYGGSFFFTALFKLNYLLKGPQIDGEYSSTC